MNHEGHEVAQRKYLFKIEGVRELTNKYATNLKNL
jgi:hypothetical protein